MKNNQILILLLVLCYIYSGCTKLDNPLIGLKSDNIIKITFEKHDSTAVANAKDKILVYAMLDSTNVAPNKDVTFKTETGTFLDDNNSGSQMISVKAEGYLAKVWLKANTIADSNNLVSARISNYTAYSRTIFSRSYPDVIRIEPIDSRYSTKAVSGATISLNVILEKYLLQTEFVSDKTTVTFNLKQSPTSNIKVVANPILWSNSNTNNLASVTCIGIDTGTVKVTPMVNGKAGDPISLVFD